MNLIDIVKLRREKIIEELYDELLKKFDRCDSVLLSTIDRPRGGEANALLVIPSIHFNQFIDKIEQKGFIIDYKGSDGYGNDFAKVKIDEFN